MVMQSGHAINCRKCGGPAAAVPGQEYYECEYCSALFQQAEVSVDRILPTGMSLGSQCPACRKDLQTGLVEGRRALFCGDCFGVLLRHSDFGAVVQERQARRVGVEPSEPRPVNPAAYQRRLCCPSCQKAMEVHPYFGPGNIVIDSCVDCGYVWLDHGELTRVEQASGTRPANRGHWDSGPETISERLQGVVTGEEGDHEPERPLVSLADFLFFGFRRL